MRQNSWFPLLLIQKICVFMTETSMGLIPHTLVRIPTKPEFHKFQGKINSKFLTNLLSLTNLNIEISLKHPFPKAFQINRNKLPEHLCLSEYDLKQSPDVKKHPVVKKMINNYTHTHTHNLL